MAYIDESVVNVALPAIEKRSRHLGGGDPMAGQCLHAVAHRVPLDRRRGRRPVRPPPHVRHRHRDLRDRVALVRLVAERRAARSRRAPCRASAPRCSSPARSPSSAPRSRRAERGRRSGPGRASRRSRPPSGRCSAASSSIMSTWRWIFLINPFVALPTIWIALSHVPESRDPQAAPGLDWRGARACLRGARAASSSG